ncbi:MAG: hypothetical protein IPN30_06545 [Flavobacteriales bacterium]|nr:hypothetical protein [Flavobacteriales bacterium]
MQPRIPSTSGPCFEDVAKWWLFLLTVPMCVGAALFYLKTTPKKYEVQSVLLLGEKKRSGFQG